MLRHRVYREYPKCVFQFNLSTNDLSVWAHYNGSDFNSERLLPILNKEFGKIFPENRAFIWDDEWKIFFLLPEDWSSYIFNKKTAYYSNEKNYK